MPCLLVQRAFPEGLASPVTADGAKTWFGMVHSDTEDLVASITSDVTVDRTEWPCFSDGPSPESVERAAMANGLAVDSMSTVRVLDLHCYPGVVS